MIIPSSYAETLIREFDRLQSQVAPCNPHEPADFAVVYKMMVLVECSEFLSRISGREAKR